MVKIKNIDTEAQVLSFLVELKEKQKKLANKDKVCYSSISLHTALKKNIFFTNLLLHPVILKVITYTEERVVCKEEELESKLREVIEYELTSDSEYLTKNERDKIIKVHKSLNKKRNGKVGNEIPV